MIKFTQEQLDVMELVSMGELPLNSLKKNNIPTLNFLELKGILDCLLENNDFYAFRVVFDYAPKNISFEEEEQLFREYLLRYNHYEHENMIASFYTTYRKNIKNIDVLVDLINNPPNYFKEEDRDIIFIDKCLDALGRQKFPESYNAIKKIFETTQNEMLKRMTGYMISNWKYE